MRLFAQQWELDQASPLSLQTHPLHLLLCGLHVIHFVLARAFALHLVPCSLVFAVFAKPERGENGNAFRRGGEMPYAQFGLGCT